MIFHGIELISAEVAHKIRRACEGCWLTKKEKLARPFKEPAIDYGKAWGFFDGSCQGAPG